MNFEHKIENELNGLLLVDKKEKYSSNKYIQKIKKALNIKKIGHCGTLDPFASGLLLVLIGKSTKFAEYLTNLDKKYTATFTLGEQKNTDDIEGRTIGSSDKSVSLDDINTELKHFRGEISQIPPQFSAIKVDGKKAYNEARKGREIYLSERSINIYSIDILNYTYPDLTLDIHVSKGTYIRSIARDLGVRLDSFAYVKTLRRTAVGNIEISHDKLIKQNDVGNDLLYDKHEITKKIISIYDIINIFNLPFGILYLSSNYIDMVKKGVFLKREYFNNVPEVLLEKNIVFDENRNAIAILDSELKYIKVLC